MLALSGQGKRNDSAPGRRRLVLPRLLRRPVRMLGRLEVHLPRNAGIKGLLLLFLATGMGGVMMGQRINELVGTLTAEAGLSIQQIRLSGQSETSEIDVLRALALPEGASLVTFDLEPARQRVEALPWVGEAKLRKLYPDTLEVIVSERSAFALWRAQSDVAIIDRQGEPIVPLVDADFAGLPLLVGANANRRAAEMVDLLGAFPQFKPRVRAAVLVANRRWTLVLENGTEILLPESDPRAALRRLAKFEADNALLGRDLKGVDLRLADRVVVRLTDEALVRRKQMLEQRARAAKKGDSA